jgi:hypothetical protein
LPLQLRRQIGLRQETVRMFADIKGMRMIPSHEFFIARRFERFAQRDHVIGHVVVVGHDAGFKPFNGEGEGVRDDEGVGGERVGAAEEHAHDFEGVS